MLDNITKKRIDDCRDILVGKLPDPKSQIEQITIALIYKFMDDMDKEAIDLGGKAKFFSGDYEKYVETDSNGAFALSVRGDSMELEFHEGDIIIINPAFKQEHNDYLVVSNEEGEATFKQLKKYSKTRVLHPLNPNYDDMELNSETEYRVIGVVIEKKKKYR